MKEIVQSSSFYSDIRTIIINARNKVYQHVNSTMIDAYWEIGKRIVDEEQGGKSRAEYGEGTLKSLSTQLTQEFGQGFDESNLRRMRQLYQLFPICDALRHELTWTHYRYLMTVENDRAREYYMNEAVDQGWGTRALHRQISSLTYERILSSKNKIEVKKHEDNIAQKDTLTPHDIIKDPYVLEFLDLPSNTDFYEKDLEKALIDKLQHFMLELGKGFSFVSRQRRFKADNDNYFVDLVFYNYILKCFVLIDLKVGALSYQNVGQMDFYVRYYEENVKTDTDNPTIGIILCTEKNTTIAKYSVLNESKQLFASKYKLYLPTEEELAKELEAERRQIENNTTQQ